MKAKKCWLLRLMPMFSVVVSLGTFLGVTQTASGNAATTTVRNPVTLVISVNRVERSALVYPAAANSPVVMCFHGFASTSEMFDQYTGFAELWPEATVVYPQGLKDIMDGHGNVNYGWQRYPGHLGNRDVYFVDALIEELYSQYGVDRQRVYATGYSNGGFLTYTLLAARPQSIAKFAPVATYMPFRPSNYTPRPVLYMFGENDHVFDNDGDCPSGGYACAMSTLDWLLVHNQTSNEAQEWFDTGYQIYPAETTSGASVIWNLHEGGHIWPPDASANIVRFFSDVVDIEIVGPAQVARNSSVSYSAIVYFENDSTCEVTNFADWSIEPNPNASISPDGVLTLGDVGVGQTIIIYCEYTTEDVIVSTEKLLTVVECEGPIPIAHWKFDEGSGAIAYDSAGNNDGTVYGAQWTTGQIGGALSFDGNGDYVDIADDVALQLASALTVTAWVYPIYDGGDYYVDVVAVKGQNVGWGPQFNYRIAMENSNLYTWGVCRSGSELYFHSGTPVYDTWQHLALTADGTTCRAYINGIEVASRGAPGPYLTFPGYALQIGGHGITNGRWFNGLIDDVRIYDRALSGEEVELLYNIQEPCPSPPDANANGPYTVFVGDTLTLDANGSTDADGDIVSFLWDLNDDGDGIFETDAGGEAIFTVDYSYLESLELLINHTYTIHLKVTDSEGQSDTADSTLTIVPKPALAVAVDIKPGSCPNPVNTKSSGVLPVAILGSADVNVIDIDPTSIAFSIGEVRVGSIRSSYEDVAAPVSDTNDCNCIEAGPDGFLDLTLKFETQKIVEAIGDVNHGDVLTLPLTGILYDPAPYETPIAGADCILIKGKHRAHNKADINKDGVVNTADFAILAENWLKSIDD